MVFPIIGPNGKAPFPIVTICGSMRYYQRMLVAASELSQQGYIVLMPFAAVEEDSSVKLMLDDMHFDKINLSQGIVVIGQHCGTSTLNEIKYANDHGKWVKYL